MTQQTNGMMHEDRHSYFNPPTKLGRFLAWVNLPMSTILCWLAVTKGVFPWPATMNESIPDNALWPSMWFLVSNIIMVFLPKLEQMWSYDPRRNDTNIIELKD